jgi:hypothetical protein
VLNARLIHNKYVSLVQWISDRRMNIAGVVETWHDSHDSPDLIACAPVGCNFVDRPRPRSGPLAVGLHTNHGGVALIYRNDLHVREISLPDYKSFEHVSAFVQCSAFNALTVLAYRPGDAPATDAFFVDFADMSEAWSESRSTPIY